MRSLLIVTMVGIGVAGLGMADLVPFVIPLEIHPQSPLVTASVPLEDNDRLAARDHFYTTDNRRVRLWGVNLSFGANFPTHQDAEKVARRLAAFGVNSVRFHHMDTSPWPRGIWTEDGKQLHLEALDRLDYFIDQLARNGIYADLNLHVGKAHSRDLGLPQAEESYDKMVSIFMPALIDAQKEYARALLTHKNPYRQKTYAEDFAVAIVEITNENSLFMWSADQVLPVLPDVYAAELRRQYNEWLKERYGTAEKIVEVWTKDSVPLGQEILTNNTFASFEDGQATPAGWTLEQHSDCKANLKKAEFIGRQALVIEPVAVSNMDWHLQLNQRSLSLKAGQVYTIGLEIASAEACQVNLSVGQSHEPWKNLGLWRPIGLTPQWRTLTLTFTATEADENARISVAFGGCKTTFAIASVSLRQGVQYAMEAGESLDQGTIGVFAGVESEPRKIDRMIFLAETEKKYFDQMRRFIKEDLSCRAMVTGTIVFGPLGLYAQSDMDFIDSHAYWQHPHFPRRPWDPGDWVVNQKAMSSFPEQAVLFKLAADRLAGKPYTVTEYNHPAPLDSQAECVPMVASFAAAQDWDGIWLYTYSHSGDEWAREHMNSYFDIDTNPGKWGFMPAGAFIFRQGNLLPRRFSLTSALAEKNQPLTETLASLHLKHGSSLFDTVGTSWQECFSVTLFRLLQGETKTAKQRYNEKESPAATVHNWEDGSYAMKNDKCWVVTGDIRAVQEKMPSDDAFRFEIETPSFSAITITALDGKSLGTESRRMLITACGRCENTDMQFSEDRRTVGRNWGKAPVRIEPVSGSIQVNSASPMSGTGVTCSALNADGSVRKTFAITGGRIPLSAEHQTMWYVVECPEPTPAPTPIPAP